MPYEPKPIATDAVRLPKSLLDLTERLAENTHEVWARRRIDEGWTFGLRRDDVAKVHPCLVPYDQLSESEKEYDRRTALEALKAIFLLGYQIIPRDEAPDPLGGRSS